MLILGCKESGDLPALQREQKERDQLEAAQKELADAEAELTELRQREVERRAAELGVPTTRQLLEDLAAATALLAQARANIKAEQPEGAATLLRRAADVVSFTSARLPRAQIAVRLARAASELSSVRPGDELPSRQWDEARFHIEEARALGVGAKSRPMYVEIDADLQTLLETIDREDAKKARTDIASLLQEKLDRTEGEMLLVRADWCIDAGIDALAGGALSPAGAWAADAQVALGKIITGLGGDEPDSSEDELPEPVVRSEPPAPASAQKPEEPTPAQEPAADSTGATEPEAPSDQDAPEAEGA